MKKTLLFAALAAATLAISCQPKEIVDIPDEIISEETDQAPVVRTFVCEFASGDTKYSISDDGVAKWEVGDEILIHAGTDGNVRTIITLTAEDISADGKKATITVTGLEPYSRSDYTSSYYAIYPASAITTSKTLYYESRMEDFSKPAMGACDDGEGKFLFYNMCGIIKYTVNGDFDSCEFSGNANETVGYNVYQCRIAKKADGSMYLDWFKYGNGYKATDVVEYKKVSFDVVSDGTSVNYIVLPRGVDFTSGFTMKFKKNGVTVKTATTNKAVNVARNKILPLGDITARLVDYVAPSFSDHTVAAEYASATDLSDKVANCYVISSPGAYKLPVVKGNDIETSAGSVYDVQLVWETYNNAESVEANSIIAGVDFDGPSNFVYFKTPSTLKAGNALIAAKDSEGNIIWSWHIWVPKTAFTNIAGIHTTALMSRNLGALIDAEASTTVANDVTSAGLFYQWGRKDPFPGPSTLDEDYPSGAKVAGTAKTVNDGQISLIESIRAPYMYGKYAGDWCSNHNSEYWGDTGSKSVYDPCPSGYRVPKRDTGKALWNGEDATFTTQAGWGYDSDHKWFTLGDPVVVFPLTGYMDSGSYNRCLKGRTAIWNAHADGDDNAYCRYVYEGPKAVRYSHNKSRGYSVRCAVDN